MKSGGDVELLIRDNQERVAWNGRELGLGLNIPANRVAFCEPLETACSACESVGLYDENEVREIISRDDWSFGEDRFDSDWITYQNGYGSCAGYGAASAVEKARDLGGQPRIELSGDYAYSKVNGGRDRGSMLDANMRSITENGVATKQTVPLGGIYPSKYDRAKADAEAKRFRAHECFEVRNEKEFYTALALRMVVVVAIHVGRNWRRFDSQDVLVGDDGPGNHCEHVDDVRYNTQTGRLEARKATSHGKDYSGDGYCWTHWGHYKTPSRYHAFYAVPSAIQDPHGEAPKWES